MENTKQLSVIPNDYLKGAPKRILFACVPADGHFNPLAGLAVHLQNMGHDVRWYTSALYAEKLQKLQIHHYSYKKALEVNGENLEEVFPERKQIKGVVKKLCFDMINIYVLRSTEYFEDIKEIYTKFPFDMVICDCCFIGIPFIREKMKLPVISIGVLPLTETSKDLAPAGLGLTPSKTFFGRRKQDILRFIVDKILFRGPTRMMAAVLTQHGIKMQGSNIFDMMARKSTLLLQSGTPGFEYHRNDLGSNIRFIGAVLPFSSKRKSWTNPKLVQYSKIILVTQGTVEKDVTKLLVPVFEAFKNSEYFVVATTGGSSTKELQKKYAHNNIIIEDFIPFADIMPYAKVYITNGGYGGVMLSIENRLPVIVAGQYEGKNEISARVGYFNLGINLTERPTSQQLKKSVKKILSDEAYQQNINRLSREFSRYHPHDLLVTYINETLNKENHVKEWMN
jgi:MGT family glycosyltransferase